MESQRGFAGDASHQLRTPLTALRLRLDRAAELMPADDPAVDQVDAARDEIDRLQRLVDGLLVLARAEGGDHDRPCPSTSAAVAGDRVEAWQPLADERGVRIELDAPASAEAQAVEPGPPSRSSTTTSTTRSRSRPRAARSWSPCASRPRGVLVLVDDEGPGLPSEDRQRAFDRFWRGSQEREGSGLGLAVVASLAEAGTGPGVARGVAARRAAGGRAVRARRERRAEAGSALLGRGCRSRTGRGTTARGRRRTRARTPGARRAPSRRGCR